MPEFLIQSLFDGPLDIVGDVHGEFDVLCSLMARLGYDKDGHHSDGRHLVFLGDLTDRGPDSPAVVGLVERLIGSGRAQCVLGNHDFNILADHDKHENKWFYGEEFIDENDNVVLQKLADDSMREKILKFFRTLPIALERDDLRIVHACWHAQMIEVARNATDAVALYEHHAKLIESDLASQSDMDDIDKGLDRQNRNPVKVLTSGLERRTEPPFEAGGRLRHEERVRWWEDYEGPPFCVFGHYALPYGEPRGNGSSYCVDFGVGKRWTERRTDYSGPYAWKLAAVRYPEKIVVFDDGESESA